MEKHGRELLSRSKLQSAKKGRRQKKPLMFFEAFSRYLDTFDHAMFELSKHVLEAGSVAVNRQKVVNQ
jgi:hypothetical protein